MRGNGIRAWSPIFGVLAIGLCLFGLSIKGAPAGDEGSSSDPRRADGTSVNTGAATTAALRTTSPEPAASNDVAPGDSTVGLTTSVPPIGNQFGADDGLSIFRAVTDAPTNRVVNRDGGTVVVGAFCNCDADCASPNTGNAADDSCRTIICTTDTSGGGTADLGEQWVCTSVNLGTDTSCDLDGLFCTADECDGAGSCIAEPAGDNQTPCLNRCDGGLEGGKVCENDLDCSGGLCLSVATCDDVADVCISNSGDTGRCCAYDVNGDVDATISGYKSSSACFTAGGTTWRRVQDTLLAFRCPKYSAGIASTFDGAGNLVEPSLGSEVGAVRRTDKVCEFDLTPCEDTNLGCLKVCVQSDGQLPTVQPQSCSADAECTTLGDGTATCKSQVCGPLACGVDPTHSACLTDGLAALGDPMRCPGEFRIGDDYSVSNGSFIALKRFSYRGGVDHANATLVFDFWDNSGPPRCTSDGSACSFIGESCNNGAGLCWGPTRVAAFAVGQDSNNTDGILNVTLDCEPNCFDSNSAPRDPEFRIPGTGYVTMRSSRAFGGKANGFWRSSGAPDVGTNDDTRAWQNGGPTIDDTMVAGPNNDALAFEIVGVKIPEPLGACCGITQLICDEAGGDCTGLLAGAACGTAGACVLSAEACDDVHRYDCRTCQTGGPRFGQLCSATRECSPLGAFESRCDDLDWKGARFNTSTPSLCASDVCNIGGCCNNGVCTNTTLALCAGPATFLGGGSTCSAAVTRQQGGGTTPFIDPDHNCCPQTHTFGACCEDTPYCAGDSTDNAFCTNLNTGTNCGTLFCENYPFDFVCSEAGGDADCGQGSAVGDACGNAGSCALPCGGAAGDNCSSTPFCSGVLGNPPCQLVCSEAGGDCVGSVVGATCGTAGSCGTAALGSTCFGSGTCTQAVCTQPTCEFCTGPIDQFIDILNSPATVCSVSGGGCDATNANGGVCDCAQNVGICNFVCADGANAGASCTLATEAADCGAGATCGVQIGASVESCVTGLPLLTRTLSGTRPLKDDPQNTGLARIFDFDDGDLCTLNQTDPGIYEVFEITDFSRVTIDLCCRTPAFTVPYFAMFEACNCAGFDFILPNIGQQGNGAVGTFSTANKADLQCASDGNLSATYSLPPGRYAYPVNSNRFCTGGGGCDDILDCPSGEACEGETDRDYQLHITAVQAQQAACCDGINCTVKTQVECEGNDQLPTASIYFPGGPNTVIIPNSHWLGSQGPEGDIVTTPVADCSINVCLLGSCCGGAGGVASCDDTPNGGVSGDGIDEATCATRTGGQGNYQGGVRCSDDPCPACPLDVNTMCQKDFASISNSSDRHHNNRIADDFIPVASTIDRLCWSGVWGGRGADVGCNQNPPDTNWYLTVYGDDGNGIPDPNNIVVGPELLFQHDGRKITDLQAAFKPTSYSGPVSISGLTVGSCYWIEIMGEGTGDLGGADSCGWNWFWTDTSGGAQGNQEPSEDGNGWSVNLAAAHPAAYTAANLRKNDYAWCADTGIAKNTTGNEGIDGGCGDRTGTFACCFRDDTGAAQCTSTLNLFGCILNPADNGVSGVVFTGVTCPDAGGTHACVPPANDDCDPNAALIDSTVCPETSEADGGQGGIGNCGKNKASWCSPLFSQCAGEDGLCIPIFDDNNVQSTRQIECGITPTDNRFATGDGPPGMDNSTVPDDCSGSDNGGGPFRADVWYQVTAPCAGKMSVTMCGSGVYDAMMAAYTACPDGNDASSPTLIDCNDDACGTFSTVSEIPAFNVTKDQEVSVRIGGWSPNGAAVPGTDGEAGQGQSGLHVRFACFDIPVTIVPVGPLTGEASFEKERYVSYDPSTNTGVSIATQVTRTGSAVDRYVDCTTVTDHGADGWYAELIDGPLPAPGDATYYCNMDAVSELHVKGCNIVPGNTYTVSVTEDNVAFSAGVAINTPVPQSGAGRQFGDTVGSFINPVWTAPNGLVTAADIVAVVAKFSLVPTAPIIARVDTDGAVPNTIVSGGDISRAVNGFAGAPFGFGVIDCLTGSCLPPCD